VRASILALALMLGGCSASEIVQGWTMPPVADLARPDYRRIIAENFRSMFPDPASLGELEISGARQVDHWKGAAWIVCLKVDAHGTPQLYAIFIQDNKIIDQRGGIVIDQCYKESYVPFSVPARTNSTGTNTGTKKPGS
jgi:hypothetical protein